MKIADYFRPQRYLIKAAERTLLQEGKGRVEWVLSRRFCLFRCFDFSGMGLKEARRALQAQLRRWSPFPRFAHHVDWHGHKAQVWIWDAARLAEQHEGAVSATVLPETLLLPRAAGDGFRLLRLAEGAEAQCWRQGALVCSTWWPEVPESAEWLAFCRDAGLPPQAPPVPDTPALQPQPWPHPMDAKLLFEVHGPRLALALGALWLMALTWELAGGLRLQRATQAMQVRNEAEQRRLEPLLAARERAIVDKAYIERLVGLWNESDQLRLMADIGEKLGPQIEQVREWHYSDGQLQFIVVGEKPDPRALVNALQGIPGFRDVRVEPLPGSGQFRISLVNPS